VLGYSEYQSQPTTTLAATDLNALNLFSLSTFPGDNTYGQLGNGSTISTTGSPGDHIDFADVPL
jgi:hypothetical protein